MRSFSLSVIVTEINRSGACSGESSLIFVYDTTGYKIRLVFKKTIRALSHPSSRYAQSANHDAAIYSAVPGDRDSGQ